MADGSQGFGVYVHWPFCTSKCPYCDFNSHVADSGLIEARFVRALGVELDHFAGLSPGRRVNSVFFGGGTPSLMAPKSVEAILNRIARNWPVAADVEITLEANPTSAEAARFSDYAQAGVNRLSIGVQSLRDEALRRLGRRHDAAEALATVAMAQDRFDRVSIDLIHTRPGQTPGEWEEELTEALALGLGHLSLYQLTIEDGTPFADLHARGRLAVADDEGARAFHDITQDLCEAVGLPAYEISNHARPGEECRHNLLYWRTGDYAGIGAGAHTRLNIGGEKHAIATLENPNGWLEAVERDGHGIVERQSLSRREQADEFLLMGLRLAEGIDLDRYRTIAARSLDAATVRWLVSEGLISLTKNRLRATGKGRAVLNRIAVELAS